MTIGTTILLFPSPRSAPPRSNEIPVIGRQKVQIIPTQHIPHIPQHLHTSSSSVRKVPSVQRKREETLNFIDFESEPQDGVLFGVEVEEILTAFDVVEELHEARLSRHVSSERGCSTCTPNTYANTIRILLDRIRRLIPSLLIPHTHRKTKLIPNLPSSVMYTHSRFTDHMCLVEVDEDLEWLPESHLSMTDVPAGESIVTLDDGELPVRDHTEGE